MGDSLRVAVIGASGIGQHHARWYHLAGCEVAAFVGTSEASCEKTRARLEAYFGFGGRAYQDVSRMLREERPDIVDVSSPHSLHRAHALAALEAGAHVVCEKPLCWDEQKGLDQILEDGRAVVEAAGRAGRLLGVSAQYPAAIPTYRAFYERVRGGWDRVEEISMEMEVMARRVPKRFEKIWIDMGSHPLSLVIGFLPGGRIDYDAATCEVTEWENRARFDYVSAQGRCAVDMVMRTVAEGPPVRRFGVNGFSVDWEGYTDGEGIYRAVLKQGEEAVRCKDFMHVFIEEFVAAVGGEGGRVVVSGEAGLQNLAYQVELLRRAKRS